MGRLLQLLVAIGFALSAKHSSATLRYLKVFLPTLDIEVVNFPTQEQQQQQQQPSVTVFYNLYTSSVKDLPRVRQLVQDQLAALKGNKGTYETIYIKSIGAITNTSTLNLFEQEQDSNSGSNSNDHQEENNPTVVLKHFEEGDEKLSLQHLWQFCRHPDTHPDQLVAYLHSKGSFHPKPQNEKLRHYLTTSVLSEECRRMPKDTCNVCSSRMSPLPHPHVSGNMWLARCDYIAKLIDPELFADAMADHFEAERADPWNRNKFKDGGCCVGMGRYSQEHWVHSHPEIAPCDVDSSSTFKWGYHSIPKNFTMELKAAPRENLQYYVRTGTCSGVGMTQKERIDEYLSLYHQEPPPTWYGWKLYNANANQLDNE